MTMTDLISRADAIEAVCDVVMDEFNTSATWGYDVAEKALSALPSAEQVTGKLKKPCDSLLTGDSDECKEQKSKLESAEAVQGWIPCSERLPDVDVEVLATVDWSDVRIAWLKKGGTWETDEYILESDEILAWMPLPKPYKGGDDK